MPLLTRNQTKTAQLTRWGLKTLNDQMEQPPNSLYVKYRQKQRSKTPVNAQRKREERKLIIK